MKILLFAFLSPFVLNTARVQAQSSQPPIQKEEWEARPTLHTLDKKYATESAVILLDKIRMEFVDGPKNEVALYRTLHRIIRVNDDKGIESFNRVYLGVTDKADIVDIIGRTILPGG
jgi:hypothetical protein